MSELGLSAPPATAGQLIDQLVAALVNVRIYAPSHPRVVNSITAVQKHLRDLGETWREDPVRIGMADGMLFFRRRPLLGSSIGSSRLIEALRRLEAGGIELGVAAGNDDVVALVMALGNRHPDGTTWAHVNRDFTERQLRHVQLLPRYSEGDAEIGGKDAAEQVARLRVAMGAFQGVIDLLQDVTVSVCRGGQIDFGAVQEHATEVLDHLRLDDGPLLNLSRHGQYDAFTFGHSARTTVLTLTLARTLFTDRELLTRIGIAAMLHDVGKALVPFELLHVQRPLTVDELAEVHRHPQLGAELLLDHRGSDPLAVAAAFGHHHSAAGHGYPCTLHDHQTSVVTEMIKICDVYEALTAARPHRRPMSPIRAYRLMVSMGNRFDRALLRRFVEHHGIYPVGQRVLLQNGEHALVRAQTRVPTAPLVELLTDEHGVEIDPGQRQCVDLAAQDGDALRLIVGELPAPDAFADEVPQHEQSADPAQPDAGPDLGQMLC